MGQLEIFDSMRFVEPRGQSPCLHAEVRFGTQAWHLANARAGQHPPLNSGQAGQKLGRSCTAIPPEAGLLMGQNVKNYTIYWKDVHDNFPEVLIQL